MPQARTQGTLLYNHAMHNLNVFLMCSSCYVYTRRVRYVNGCLVEGACIIVGSTKENYVPGKRAKQPHKETIPFCNAHITRFKVYLNLHCADVATSFLTILYVSQYCTCI